MGNATWTQRVLQRGLLCVFLIAYFLQVLPLLREMITSLQRDKNLLCILIIISERRDLEKGRAQVLTVSP